MTILTPLRLLSSGLCASADVIDEGLIATTGMPRLYRVPPDAPFFDVEPLYAFFVFTRCDIGEPVLRWHLDGPAGMTLVSRVREQRLTWDCETNVEIVRVSGLVSGSDGVKPGVYDLVFELGGMPLTRLGFIVEVGD